MATSSYGRGAGGRSDPPQRRRANRPAEVHWPARPVYWSFTHLVIRLTSAAREPLSSRGETVFAIPLYRHSERKDRMDQTRRKFLALVAAGLAILALFGKTVTAEPPAFPVSTLTIETARGRFPFVVEIAETPSAWQQGLQLRQSLAADAGMLFNFHQPRVASMWMKDTLIPLDMIFIDQRGAVVNVAENTVPLSSATLSSNGPVLAVLEVNAGTAARLGMRPGDRVRHPMFSVGVRRAAPN